MNATQLRQAFVSLNAHNYTRPERDTWERHAWELRKHVLHDDISSFLRWQTLIATMAPDASGVILTELEELQSDRNWPFWRSAMRDPGVGGGETTAAGGGYTTNGALIHQAYHLWMFESFTGVRADTLPSIDEFGAGFGAMSYLCWALGFRGQYVIRDLPEFSLLQAYYLSQCGVPLVADAPGVTWIGKGHQKESDGLFIACYSMSEVTPEDRMKQLQTRYAHYLIAYQDYFNGVDNCAWFAEFAATCHEIEWTNTPAAHPGCYYLIGTRKNE